MLLAESLTGEDKREGMAFRGCGGRTLSLAWQRIWTLGRETWKKLTFEGFSESKKVGGSVGPRFGVRGSRRANWKWIRG